MLDKYSKIQDLIDEQKKKCEKILEVFEDFFCKGVGSDLKMSKRPNLEINFPNKNGVVIKINVKDKSSIKFLVLKNQDKICKELKKHFPKDIFKIC